MVRVDASNWSDSTIIYNRNCVREEKVTLQALNISFCANTYAKTIQKSKNTFL
jgi:hypothetical protein